MTAKATPPGPLARAAEISLRFLLIAGAIAVVAFVLVQLRVVVLPIVLALFAATVLVPPARWLERRGWPGTLAALVVMVVAAGLIAGAVAAAVPTVVDELDDLGTSARRGLEDVVEWLTTGPLGLSEREIQSALDRGLQQLRDESEVLAGGLFRGALAVAELVAGLLLAVVLVFFFVRDGAQIWGWVVDLFPSRARPDAREVGRRSWSALSGYVRGMALVAVVDAVLIGLALAVIGVPLVVPLMALTFFGAFVPLVGAFVAGLVAALVALVSQGVVPALLVTGAIVVIQQLEGDLIYPQVVGRSVSLHPVAVLLAVAAGAVVAGIAGAVLAVPLAAVLWTTVAHLRDARPEAPEPA